MLSPIFGFEEWLDSVEVCGEDKDVVFVIPLVIVIALSSFMALTGKGVLAAA